MTIEQAGEWFDAMLSAMDPSEQGYQRRHAAFELARSALQKWEDLLDIEQDYKAAAETSSRLQDQFCKVSPAIYESGEIFRCPRCHSYVKWTYYHCPNCGQKLRRDTYRIIKK